MDEELSMANKIIGFSVWFFNRLTKIFSNKKIKNTELINLNPNKIKIIFFGASVFFL